MRWLLRLVGLIVLLLSAVGIVACLAVAGGVWWAEQKAAQKVETTSTRLDAGVERLSSATENVRDALQKARKDVAEVNKQAGGVRAGGEGDQATNRLVRRLIQERVGPELNNLDGRLATVADVSVAVASLLRSLREMPAGQATGITPEDMENASRRATELSAALKTLQDRVGQGDDAADAREVALAGKNVEEVLERCEATVEDWQSHLKAAHEELPDLKARVLRWLLLGSVVVTVLAAWFTLAQSSLFVHAWKWSFGA
jgi:outer membrane murein-binding lipoprotein Lpp